MFFFFGYTYTRTCQLCGIYRFYVMDEICHRLERLGASFDGLCEKDFTSVLQKLSEMLRESENRSKLPETTMATLCHTLGSCVMPQQGTGEVPLTSTQGDLQTVCCWCLRCLRNACAQSSSNQRLIWNAGAVDSVKTLISLVSAAPGAMRDELAVLLRCAVQLLGNLVSGQPDLQALAWKEIFPHTLHSVFEYDDPKASQYLCMVINMCLQDSSSVVHACQLWTSEGGYQLLEAIFALSQTESEQDFSLELIRTLIGIPDFIPSVFNHLTVPSRIILLDILAALLSSDQDGSLKPLPDEAPPEDGNQGKEAEFLSALTVELLAKVFEEEASNIFGLISEDEWSRIKKEQKPRLLTRLLNTLCIASTNHRLKSTLQEKLSLLECSLGLLERANNAGKKDKNKDLLTAMQTLGSADAEASELFGFKRDLVRLIGNMCHDHTANQNKVRELHSIPVILEQCNMDDNNPFISQWAILAIRNLCDGNPLNQAVIAEMNNQGVINNDQLLQYGFHAEWRDGRMYYRSTKKK